MVTRGVSLVAACLVGVLLGTAAADDKSGKQKRADELFVEGRKLLEAGDNNAAAACEKFNEAIKLDPEAPGTMLNLGLCNELLFKYKTALYWFRKAQARAAETGLNDYEAAAKEHTVALKKDKVATIKIVFATPAPDGTKVKIDGEEVAPADYLAAEVDPGPHEMVVGAPGKKIVNQPFNVEGRGGQTITIELVEGDNVTISDPGAGRRKVAIITAAGGGVLLLASLGVSLYALGNYNDCGDNGELKLDEMDATKLHSDCRTALGLPDQTATTEQKERARDHTEKYRKMAAYWGTGLFVAGVATVGVAAFLYFTAPDKERIDRTVFVPTLSPNEVGFALTRSF